MPNSFRGNTFRGLCCPILGMHRSGTSCLARILNAAGMDMGANLSLETHLHNLVGHWEPLDMIRINDRILTSSGGDWQRVPEKLVFDDDVGLEIQTFLGQFTDSTTVVGWKDPRLTITFPVWRPYLSNYQLVASVRHPYAVANSLKERADVCFQDGVRLWTDYNERLLQYAEEVPRIFWFHYDGSPEEYAASLRSLCEYAGLRFSADLMKLFNRCLTHQASPADVGDLRVRKVYQRLLELSQDQHGNPAHATADHRATDDRAASVRSSPPAAELQHSAEAMSHALDDQQGQIAQVVEALRSITLNQQREQKALRSAIERIHSLEQRLQSLEPRLQSIAQLAAQLSEETQPLAHRLQAVEQWAVLRGYRAVRSFIGRQLPWGTKFANG